MAPSVPEDNTPEKPKAKLWHAKKAE